MTEIKMENGRSMVEMLGVLAVAGVLSIGGVAGYRYAIDKMNANDIINEVKKRAVTASQQRILGQNVNLSEYGDNGRIKGIHVVTATNDYAGDKGFFALTVSAVPQRVCDDILKQDWAMPVETAVGGVVVDDDTTCAEGENEYRLSTGECVTDSHPECADGEFFNVLTGSCSACPTDGNPVETFFSTMEDTCERCTGGRNGLYGILRYCVYCSTGVVCGDQCCGEGEMCQYSSGSGICVSTLEDGECWTNDDCTGANQYCKENGACEVTIETCTGISSTPVIINEKTYTASTDSMSYHAAENFCNALGKSLVSVEENCTAEELAVVKATNYPEGSYCTGWSISSDTQNSYWTSTKAKECAAYWVSPRTGLVESCLYGCYFNALCR